ncbi:MAG: GerMN domain-containing protein [Candidatus Eisenbacteria bacterium]
MAALRKRGSRALLIIVLLLMFIAIVVAVFALVKRRPPEETVPQVEQPAEGEVGTKAALLYFGAPDGSELIETTREIMASSEPSALLASVVRELVAGPSEGGVAVIPAGTKLRSAYVEGGRAYLDFSQELKSEFPGGSMQEFVLLASIVRTVSANFADVRYVQILVEGASVESVGGHYDTAEPLDAADWQ